MLCTRTPPRPRFSDNVLHRLVRGRCCNEYKRVKNTFFFLYIYIYIIWSESSRKKIIIFTRYNYFTICLDEKLWKVFFLLRRMTVFEIVFSRLPNKISPFRASLSIVVGLHNVIVKKTLNILEKPIRFKTLFIKFDTK